MIKKFLIIKLVIKVTNRINWLLEDLIWMFSKSFYRIRAKKTNFYVTIGITTFMDRYENCFKPLLSKLKILAPDCQIIVSANGHVKSQEQKEYIKQITELCNRFNNVQLIAYIDPKGLSHLWNQIIRNAHHEKVLLLNDDIKIKVSFTHFISRSGILDQKIATINKSWSHFLISKQIIDLVGWFDEGLKEIGGEDDDYAARIAIEGIELLNFFTKSISGKLRKRQKQLSINSYGKIMDLEKNGYSTYNSEYLEKKWDMSDEYFEGATEVPNRLIKYWKLKKIKGNQ